VLVEIAESQPMFLKKTLPAFADGMIKITGNTDLEDGAPPATPDPPDARDSPRLTPRLTRRLTPHALPPPQAPATSLSSSS